MIAIESSENGEEFRIELGRIEAVSLLNLLHEWTHDPYVQLSANSADIHIRAKLLISLSVEYTEAAKRRIRRKGEGEGEGE
jgi:hypothetical protein